MTQKENDSIWKVIVFILSILIVTLIFTDLQISPRFTEVREENQAEQSQEAPVPSGGGMVGGC